jgi:hypothetical protein
MKWTVSLTLVLEVGLLSVVFGQTNLITVSELDSATSDWPKSVTATTNISVTTKSGDAVITKGGVLPVLSVSNVLVSTVYQGMTNRIPAVRTDIIEQINDLRRHRLIVGKEQYDNYRLVPYNPAEVKIFHRTGIAVVLIAQLSAELQAQLGYEKDKAEEFLAKRREEEQLRRKQQARQKLADQRLADPIGVGSVGVLYSVHVVQITGPDEMLAEIPVAYIYESRMYDKPVHSSRKELVFIKGVSTDGLIDGHDLKTESVFRITGTKRYGTAMGGTKTVFVLEPTSE